MKVKKKPIVSIVGAGPGDKDLITVKGLKALQTADVILYDALVNFELLKEAPEHAMKIFVGKRAGKPCIKQDMINEMIVKLAIAHGHVVRLKGGDPFVFGRGHEELNFAQACNIPTKVIPGISSAISLPLLQHVPVTRRHISESFWVLTGSTKEHKLSKDIRLASKSSATLVILMGIRKLAFIQNILIEEGKANLPIMVIQSGSTHEEKVVMGTTQDIVSLVKEANIGTPGIIVVGEVVRLHPQFIIEKYTSLCA